MNSNFRRDYLYKLEKPIHNGIQETFLRYLKFDKTTREYVFIEGSTRNKDELQLRIAQTKSYNMLNRIKKLHRIGYEETDQYFYNTRLLDQQRKKARRGAKRPSLVKTDKVINHFNDLKIGNTYKIKVLDSSVYINNTTYVLDTLEPTRATLVSKSGLKQSFLDTWLNKGLIRVTELV